MNNHNLTLCFNGFSLTNIIFKNDFLYQREVKEKETLSVTGKVKGLGETDEYPSRNSNPKHLNSQRLNKGRHCYKNIGFASANTVQ